MNDEGALHRRPRLQLHRDSEGSSGVGRLPPRIDVRLELEELPVVHVTADSESDEARLREWLTLASVRRRLHEQLDDAIDSFLQR
jgi:hypothetical protein